MSSTKESDSPTAGARAADPELAERARRGQFTAESKLGSVEKGDACTKPGELGALLRHEGLYSSHLSTLAGHRDASPR